MSNRVAYTELITGDRFIISANWFRRLTGQSERVTQFAPVNWGDIFLTARFGSDLVFSVVAKDGNMYVYDIYSTYDRRIFTWAELRSTCRVLRFYGVQSVPTILQGLYSENMIQRLLKGKSLIDGVSPLAGIVVRPLDGIESIEVRND